MGRPRKALEDKYATPARILGRIPANEWDELRNAAKRSGETFTQWATNILLAHARRSAKKESQ